MSTRAPFLFVNKKHWLIHCDSKEASVLSQLVRVNFIKIFQGILVFNPASWFLTFWASSVDFVVGVLKKTENLV